MRSRYIYQGGKVVYAEERGQVIINDMPQSEDAGYFVMGDIQPYTSMIDGSEITSRSHHRMHLKQHGCIEVGNDSSVMNPKPRPLQPPPGLKDSIIRAVHDVERKYRR